MTTRFKTITSIVVLGIVSAFYFGARRKRSTLPQGMLSKYLSHAQATASATAKANGLSNEPSAEHLENIKALATNVYDRLVDKFGTLRIESVYRSVIVNAKVGGSTNSQHTKGQAIDIKSGNAAHTNADVFNYIVQHLPFDQVIWEFGTSTQPQWIHVSYNRAGNRKKITVATKENGKIIYRNK